METVTSIDRFLICGLGSLGQYCLFHLGRFAVPGYGIQIRGIDRAIPEDWEITHLGELLDGELILGDCRQEETLLKAGVQDCRAVLLVTQDESVNVEAAIAARRLNPHIRLVVRSSRPQLNRLLEQQLGNFVALEPTAMAAHAFALEGLGSSIRGIVNLDQHQLQVVERQVLPGEHRFDQLPVHQLHRRSYRLINGSPSPQRAVPERLWVDGPSETFHRLAPDWMLAAGDRVTYVELVPSAHGPSRRKGDHRGRLRLPRQLLPRYWWRAIARPRTQWQQFRQWLQDQPARQVIGLGLLLALGLGLLGTLSLKLGLPQLTWQKAISTALILLLGGYGDVFGGLDNEAVSVWLQAISLLITLISLAFVFGGLGLLAERLISARFGLFRRRPVIPQQQHAIVIGLGRVGQRITTELQRFRQPLVAISTARPTQPGPSPLDLSMPLLMGNPVQLLQQANLATAKSVIIVTDDQLLNLELALTVREAIAQVSPNPVPGPGLVVRTFDQRFSDNLSQLLPDVQVLTVHGIAAEAFAGAAFGEDILTLFRLQDQTILVTEYQVERDDTLMGKRLGQVAYGYGVMPIFHQPAGSLAFQDASDGLMPGDEVLLKEGDRLVVLASINGLRRIEHGEAFPAQRWRLNIQKPLNPEFLHSGGNTLARVGGLPLEQARAFMATLPNVLELGLYAYQAESLRRELGKQLVIELIAISEHDV